MSYGYAIKEGDTARRVIDELKLDGIPLDLTNTSVWFVMISGADHTVYLEQPAVVVDALKGKVTYAFKAAETAKAGLYNCEWLVKYPSGTQLTVPDNESVTLEIVKRVRKVGNVPPNG